MRRTMVALGLTLVFPSLAMAADCDNDGVADNDDNCVCKANPDQEDDDFDGLGNACDVFPNNHNGLDERIDAFAEAIRKLLDGPPFLVTLELQETLAGRCRVATSPVEATDPDGEPSRLAACWEVVDAFAGEGTYPYPTGAPWGPSGPSPDSGLVGEALAGIEGLHDLKLSTLQDFLGEELVEAAARDEMLADYRGLAY